MNKKKWLPQVHAKEKIVMRYVDNKYDIHNLSCELWVNPGPLLPTSKGLGVLYVLVYVVGCINTASRLISGCKSTEWSVTAAVSSRPAFYTLRKTDHC